MKILFIIRCLETGGAERQLTNLALGLKAQGIDVHVAVLRAGFPLEQKLKKAGIAVHMVSLWGFGRLCRHLRPDIVHGYLHVGNILALLGKVLGLYRRAIMGVRHSFRRGQTWSWKGNLALATESILSRWADAIITNAFVARESCIANGMPIDRILVIPNGIDTDFFKAQPKPAARKKKVILCPARLVQEKGQIQLVKALAMMADIQLICVGQDNPHYRAYLEQIAGILSVNLTFLPKTEDMISLYRKADLVVLPSLSAEGLPNVLIEALSCSRPVVASDFGPDYAALVGPYGQLVPPNDPAALRTAIIEVLTWEYDPLDLHAHIAKNYSIPRLTGDTLKVLETIAQP